MAYECRDNGKILADQKICAFISSKYWTVFPLVLDSQYNRKDEKRHHRSVLFLIQNTVTGHQSLYEIDRISKHTASLRCNARQCDSRSSIEHDILTEPFGKKGRSIASACNGPMSCDFSFFSYHFPRLDAQRGARV